MAFQTEQDIVLIHAFAIIDDPDKTGSATFDLDLDMVGPGIEAVFQQLFDDGSRALDDLACGDLVDQLLGEDADDS